MDVRKARLFAQCGSLINIHTCRSLYIGMVRTKFTTSGDHDVISITSPQKNDLCNEELRDRPKIVEDVSLPLRKGRFGCLFFRSRKGTLELTLA